MSKAFGHNQPLTMPVLYVLFLLRYLILPNLGKIKCLYRIVWLWSYRNGCYS